MTVHIRIYGQVQGVFFRRQTKAMADSLGLVGWVRNRQSLRSSSLGKLGTAGLNNDGWVEAVAQGPKDKLEEFVKWCRRGPFLASVENVEVEWKKSKRGFGDFEVR